MAREETLPTSDFAFDLLKKLKVPYNVRRHSLKVAEKALVLAEKIRLKEVDMDLIEIGGLLHDIGRCQTHGFKHALIGAKIIRERGLSERLAIICETHILGGLDKEDAKQVGLPERDFLPLTLEEKVICLADKFIAGTKEVTIEQRFEKWFNKYGRTQILTKAKERIEKIQKEIEALG
ncbi:MAG: HDIG domain-containing protein [Candidatus Lokiarchaeota archaeon]|nr:HDIG domain-containing protein [Candidatus Lokiarchaeota archaeon]